MRHHVLGYVSTYAVRYVRAGLARQMQRQVDAEGGQVWEVSEKIGFLWLSIGGSVVDLVR